MGGPSGIDAGWANDRLRGLKTKSGLKTGEDGSTDTPTTGGDKPTEVTSDGHGGYNPSFFGSSYTTPKYTLTPFAPFQGQDEQGAAAFAPQSFSDGSQYGRWKAIGMPPGAWKPLFSGADPFSQMGGGIAPGNNTPTPTPPPQYGTGMPKPPIYRPPTTTPPGPPAGPLPPGYGPDPSTLPPPINNVGPSGPYPGPSAPSTPAPPTTTTPPGGGGGGGGTVPRPGAPGSNQKIGATQSYTPGLGSTPPSIAQIQRAIGLGQGAGIDPSVLNKYGVSGASYDPTAIAVNSMGAGTLSGLQSKYANPQDWLKAQGYNANYIKSQPTSWADYTGGK